MCDDSLKNSLPDTTHLPKFTIYLKVMAHYMALR